MSQEETRRAVELEKYFAVLPAFRGIYYDIDYDYPGIVSDTVTNPYVSENENACTVPKIREILHDNQLLGEPEEPTARRYWPGDKEEKN